MSESGKKYAGGDDRARLAQAAKLIQENRAGVVLTGRIVNGRVELDKASLDDIQDRFPDGDVAFVAVNAPFDPNSQLA
jgi:hypothetical protein